jgi:nitrogen regulatory protein PII
MLDNSKCKNIDLVCAIVNFGLGSKIIHKAKQEGIFGGTILLCKGTVNNKVLGFFGLTDVRKEIVLMAGERDKAYKTLEKLDKEFKFEKPNHGIAFTTSISNILGTRSCKNDGIEERGVDNIMYQAITVIVDKGKAEDVIDAATKAGSKGGTIINGRGSGIHETSKLFAMEIEPEKEIVIILSKKEDTDKIVSSIREEIKIDEPGNGIIYTQDINKAYGLYE